MLASQPRSLQSCYSYPLFSWSCITVIVLETGSLTSWSFALLSLTSASSSMAQQDQTRFRVQKSTPSFSIDDTPIFPTEFLAGHANTSTACHHPCMGSDVCLWTLCDVCRWTLQSRECSTNLLAKVPGSVQVTVLFEDSRQRAKYTTRSIVNKSRIMQHSRLSMAGLAKLH